MDLVTVNAVLWRMLLDALDGDDPERTYALAAAFGLVVEVLHNPSPTLDFAGCADLIRFCIRPLMAAAAERFADGDDAGGEAIIDAVFRLVEQVGIQVGG